MFWSRKYYTNYIRNRWSQVKCPSSKKDRRSDNLTQVRSQTLGAHTLGSLAPSARANRLFSIVFEITNRRYVRIEYGSMHISLCPETSLGWAVVWTSCCYPSQQQFTSVESPWVDFLLYRPPAAVFPNSLALDPWYVTCLQDPASSECGDDDG